MASHITGALYAERAGRDGTPVLLIHALPNDHSMFLYQIAHFSTWYRVVAVDLPGLGRSPRAEPGLTMSDLAVASLEALDGVTRDAAIVIGVSIGAGVAKHIAAQAPERTLALILTGAGYYERDGGPVAKGILERHEPAYRHDGIAYRRAHLARNFSDGFAASGLGRYFVDLFAQRDDTADVASILALMRAHDPADREDLHGRIRSPTLIVTGAEDRSRAQQEALRSHIAGAEQLVIPGAGHLCNMEDPVAYDRVVLDFLARHGLGPSSRSALG
jgi:pimeloyl-ACP methyl ester carboxylesterase